MFKYWYLVAYDISSPKRLRWVHKKLTANGYPLQNSIFLCQGKVSEIKLLYKQLCSKINPKEDDLRIFPLSSNWNLQFWGICPLRIEIHNNLWPHYKDLNSGQWLGRVVHERNHFDSVPTKYA